MCCQTSILGVSIQGYCCLSFLARRVFTMRSLCSSQKMLSKQEFFNDISTRIMSESQELAALKGSQSLHLGTNQKEVILPPIPVSMVPLKIWENTGICGVGGPVQQKDCFPFSVCRSADQLHQARGVVFQGLSSSQSVFFPLCGVISSLWVLPKQGCLEAAVFQLGSLLISKILFI